MRCDPQCRGLCAFSAFSCADARAQAGSDSTSEPADAGNLHSGAVSGSHGTVTSAPDEPPHSIGRVAVTIGLGAAFAWLAWVAIVVAAHSDTGPAVPLIVGGVVLLGCRAAVRYMVRVKAIPGCLLPCAPACVHTESFLRFG